MIKTFHIVPNFFKKVWIALLLFIPYLLQSQDSIPHTLQDSLFFTQNAFAWKILPSNKDSLTNWQVAGVLQVLFEKTNERIALCDADFRSSSERYTTLASALDLLKVDTTASKDSIKVLNKRVKTALKKGKDAKNLLAQAETLRGQLEAGMAMDAPTRRKNMPKLFKKWLDLDKKYTSMHQSPEPPATLSPVVVAVDPVIEDTKTTTIDSMEVDSSRQSGNRLSQLRKKLKPKEKQPEKPQPAQYDPAKDVMLNPPAIPCAMALERKDEFSGAIYKETKKVELLRFTNSMMKKVLPEGQAHIICKAALASDGGNGKLLLDFEIKDQNARRSFGGLAPKSILGLRFMDGELMTLFNEGNQEALYDPETGITLFRGIYSIQSTVLKKMEKIDLDQIRVAWSTGYEDYGVHHVGLFQNLSTCIK
jgi:hypothetical protein